MTPPSASRGLLIAAPASGSGKTVLTLALLRALKGLGHRERGAKAGPDFIDPMFHEIAAGCASYNLDPWAMAPVDLSHLFHRDGNDLMVVEAMMGLFDGAADGSGSAGDLAQILGLPIVFVVDCSKQSHSLAALINGFHNHRQGVEISGIILNKVGSERHETLLREAVAPLQIPVVGAVYRHPQLELPARHLGLVQANEIEGIEAFIAEAAGLIGTSCDLDALVQLARPGQRYAQQGEKKPPLGQKIAVAKDLAFSFLYPHHLLNWRQAGAAIEFFSPLADQAPPPDCDAVYLPGGYPELHGPQLAGAVRFKQGLHEAARRGALIYGECGGYMVLGQGIVDRSGDRHQMTGLLNLETSFHTRRLNLGYRQVRSEGFRLGNPLMCHEFHYSTIVHERGEALFVAEDARGDAIGNCGLRQGNVMGSYLHVIAEAAA